MSYLSTALESALHELRWRQSELAQQAQITPVQANRAVRSKSVGPEIVAKIVRALPEPHGSRVLAAYLRDSIPHGLAHLIRIESQSNHVREDPADVQAILELDPELRALILRFAHRATIRTEFRDLLKALESGLDTI